MSKKNEHKFKDCIGDEMKGFKPIGSTSQERAESVMNAFRKAAEDCNKKLNDP